MNSFQTDAVVQMTEHPSYLCDYDAVCHMDLELGHEKKNDAVEYMKENLGRISQREMSRRLGIGRTTINRWSSELGFRPVKHSVNEKFFDVLTEESSYVLGYVFADGNVCWDPEKSYRSLTITASEKDKGHLEMLRSLVSSTKPLLYSEKTKSYRMIATSKSLCESLIARGVLPRKSLSAEFPGVPDSMMRHFVRGVIDGDGNVRYVDRKRSPYFEITVSSGSESFITSLRDVIRNHISVDARLRKVGKNTFLVQYSCERGMKLAEWVYHDSGLFMVRKFEQYKKALVAKRRCVSL